MHRAMTMSSPVRAWFMAGLPVDYRFAEANCRALTNLCMVRCQARGKT
jgi:hypothetical protein